MRDRRRRAGRPLVSVLFPVRNGRATAGRALRSVLRQTWRDLEVIVIDDGSTDGTPSAIRAAAGGDRRVRLLRNRRPLGITGALNRGLAAARGAYVARVDHDDEWIRRDKLARQVARLEADPGLVLIGTAAQFVDEAGRTTRRRRYPVQDRDIRARLFVQNPFVHSSVAFRRSALARTGPYPALPLHVEDLHLWLELGAHGRFAILPAPMVRVTERPASLSQRHAVRQQWGLLRLIWTYRGRYPGAAAGLLRHGVRMAITILRGWLRPLRTGSPA